MTAAKRTLHVSVIGAGDRGTAHARAWAQTPDAKIVSVTDVDADRAQKLADELDIPVVTPDYREAVDRAEVDVVSVCTPAYFHPDIALFALERGKHVFCEKPMALTMDLAEQMAEAAGSAGLVLGICHQLRYASAVQKIRDLIQAGAIGRPVLIRQMLNGLEIRPKRAMHDLLHGNAGPVVDVCCHQFDMAALFLGAKPTRVTARGLTLAQGRRELQHIEQLAPDAADIIVEYDTGDIQCVSVCWGLAPKVTTPGQQDICGPKGAIVWTPAKLTLLTEGGKKEEFGPYKEDMNLACVADFAKAVRKGAPAADSLASALQACRISLAAMDSIAEGVTIELDD